MTNVISMNCTCDYLIQRAAKHRRSGRYDEAMALLWKARNQFGPVDDVLWEMACVYDEMGCEAEAEKTYLRLVRLREKHRAKALFHLAVSSAQRGDFQRASSYYESFLQAPDRNEIDEEIAEVFARQLSEESADPVPFSAKQKAKSLEKRAAAALQAGRVAAAQRNMEHTLRLKPSARGYTMLACCQLLRNRFDEAIASAKAAHKLSPSNIQTLCVLADAYSADGQLKRAINTIYLASLRVDETDDLLALCVESAKAGCDALTLRITGRILKRAPFHTRAMMLRACAHINRGEEKAAERLLGRLCGLLPESTICESYYRMLRNGTVCKERLSLGADVIHEEGVNRAAELIRWLYADPKEIDENASLCMSICRMCDWVFYSPMAGPSTKMAALVLLAGLQSQEAKGILLDLLLSPHLSDSLKLSALQVLTAKDGFYPYDVDMGGKLVRLAAGGVSAEAVPARESNAKVVQRVADRLLSKEEGAAQTLLNVYLKYVKAHGQPERKYENVCAAALEYWYIKHTGNPADEERIAKAYSVPVRRLRVFAQRFESCMQEDPQTIQGE